MTCFVDASALVKRYADEAGSEVVRTLVPPLVISALSGVEVPAAIWRKHRAGELSAAHASVLHRAFETDWRGGDPGFVVVDLASPVLDSAARCVAVHDLRAGDAIQLACALAVRDVVPDVERLVAFDGRLRAAARAEGFTVVP